LLSKPVRIKYNCYKNVTIDISKINNSAISINSKKDILGYDD